MAEKLRKGGLGFLSKRIRDFDGVKKFEPNNHIGTKTSAHVCSHVDVDELLDEKCFSVMCEYWKHTIGSSKLLRRFDTVAGTHWDHRASED